MRNALVAAALTLAVPMCAQNQTPLEAVQTPNVSAAVTAAAARSHALEATLTNMGDGDAFSGLVRAYMERHGITVEFATQAPFVKTVSNGGNTKILLSDELPPHPRVYAPLIALGAMNDLIPSVESFYLRDAVPARVFNEFGGETAKLPVVDGDSVPGLAKIVSGADSDVQSAMAEISKGNTAVLELQSLRSNPDQRARADEADSFFNEYLSAVRFGRR